MFNEKEGQTNYCPQCEELQAKYNAAQERIHQFDRCIRAVADALEAPACGGVDTDTSDPYGTTAVLVGRAKELADRVKQADDRVRVLTEILTSAIKELKLFSDEAGGCDHSVGICMCDTFKLIEDAEYVINATPKQTTKDDEVLACPFCGSTDISDGEALIGKDDGTTAVQSQCLACGAFVPEASLEQGEIDFGDVKAIAAWNRRLRVPQQTAEQIERWHIEWMKTLPVEYWFRDGEPTAFKNGMAMQGFVRRLVAIPPLPKE